MNTAYDVKHKARVIAYNMPTRLHHIHVML